MDSFTFKIITPERVVFEATAKQATLPTSSGEITVLPNHIPLMSELSTGELSVVLTDGTLQSMAVSGGFLKVGPDSVTILADTAEMAHEIDVAQAEEAVKRAQELAASKAGARDHDFAALKVLMDKEFARLKVARKYKQRGIRTGDINGR